MNLELFVAKRIFYSKEDKNNISRPIAKIAVFSIALSLVVMICTIAIITGFKNEIRNKITMFSGHIQIVNYDSNFSYETGVPVNKYQSFYPSLDTLAGIRHIQVFALKAGIIKTKDNIQGVVIKGIDTDFNWDNFEKSLIKGNKLDLNERTTSNNIIISQHIASLLKLDTGDKVTMYFVQDPPRMRRFVVQGIYNTGMEEMDKIFILADIKHTQKLNNWNEDEISGFEVFISDFSQIEEMTETVRNYTGYNFDEFGAMMRTENVMAKYPQIFDWLGLFDLNVLVIIILMLAVAGFNMISGLLILILERTNMIGILKSFGTTNIAIQKIFLYISGFMILKGLLWGNIIGIVICFIQKSFKFIELDPSAYFLNAVPINLQFFHLFFINLGSLAAVILILVLPSFIISRISPSKTIQFN